MQGSDLPPPRWYGRHFLKPSRGSASIEPPSSKRLGLEAKHPHESSRGRAGSYRLGSNSGALARFETPYSWKSAYRSKRGSTPKDHRSQKEHKDTPKSPGAGWLAKCYADRATPKEPLQPGRSPSLYRRWSEFQEIRIRPQFERLRRSAKSPLEVAEQVSEFVAFRRFGPTPCSNQIGSFCHRPKYMQCVGRSVNYRMWASLKPFSPRLSWAEFSSMW